MAILEVQEDDYYQIPTSDPINLIQIYDIKVTVDPSFTNMHTSVYDWAQTLKPVGGSVTVTLNTVTATAVTS